MELGEYRHYMQKEIFKQPQALGNTLEMLGGAGRLQPGIFGADAEAIFAEVDSVLILACGTSNYAGMTARYWIEQLANLPCSVEIASEYRYRHSVANPRQLVVVISQSVETADTLAALHHAKAMGHTHTLAICNVPESAIVRETALRFITRAGPEIGVASTKAFTTQLAALFLITLLLAKANWRTRVPMRDWTAVLKINQSRPSSPSCAICRWRWRRCWHSNRRSRPGPSILPTSSTRSSWAAGITTPLPWKGRSSLRRSPISTPRPTRPASSSTAPWPW